LLLLLLGPQWWEKLFEAGTTGLVAIPFVAKGVPHGEYAGLCSTLELFLSHIGGKLAEVDSAFAVNNSLLRFTFKNSLRLLEGKLTDTKNLFKKEDWKEGFGREAKAAVLTHLGDYTTSFRTKEWNNGTRAPIVPLIQRLPRKLAWLVLKHGFRVLPSHDGALYGKGLYFTNNLHYLNACSPPPDGGEEFVYVLSLVVPGNSFPVVQRPDDFVNSPLINHPCRPGYQSHYSVANWRGLSAGELVVFDPCQALPLYIWTPKRPPPLSDMVNFRKEWNLVVDFKWNCLNFYLSIYLSTYLLLLLFYQ
jgi:hypothetical protein